MSRHNPYIITHADVLNFISRQTGYDKKIIDHTIRGFFASYGLKGYIKKGQKVHIVKLGTFKSGSKRKVIDRRLLRVKRTTERIKKNNYNRKKSLTK